MKKYRSKPVEIEAVQWDGVTKEPILNMMGQPAHINPSSSYFFEPMDSLIKIKTLEGIMTAKPGDWIIKGTEGEFYPCKDSVFQTKYEEIE